MNNNINDINRTKRKLQNNTKYNYGHKSTNSQLNRKNNEEIHKEITVPFNKDCKVLQVDIKWG